MKKIGTIILAPVMAVLIFFGAASAHHGDGGGKAECRATATSPWNVAWTVTSEHWRDYWRLEGGVTTDWQDWDEDFEFTIQYPASQASANLNNVTGRWNDNKRTNGSVTGVMEIASVPRPGVCPTTIPPTTTTTTTIPVTTTTTTTIPVTTTTTTTLPVTTTSTTTTTIPVTTTSTTTTTTVPETTTTTTTVPETTTTTTTIPVTVETTTPDTVPETTVPETTTTTIPVVIDTPPTPPSVVETLPPGNPAPAPTPPPAPDVEPEFLPQTGSTSNTLVLVAGVLFLLGCLTAGAVRLRKG